MLNWLFKKRTPPTPLTDYRQAVAQLAREEDAGKRAELEAHLNDLLARLLDRSADSAQVAVWTLGDKLTAQLREQHGATNDMLGDLRAGIGGLQEQLSLLQGTFSERLDEHEIALGELKQGQAGIKAEVGALNARHGEQIEAITEEQARQATQLREIMREIEELRQESAERLTGEEQQAKVRQIANHEERLRRLEGEA